MISIFWKDLRRFSFEEENIFHNMVDSRSVKLKKYIEIVFRLGMGHVFHSVIAKRWLDRITVSITRSHFG